jgi:hypothetical protein
LTPRLSFECPEPRKRLAFKTIEFLIHENWSLLPYLRDAIRKSAIDCRTLVDREALSADQLRQLSSNPLARD